MERLTLDVILLSMDVRHLRYFLALAQEQHFGRAAERAHIEPSPLSRTISQLENELGVPLFIRSRQGTTLTPAGEVLQGHALQILTAFERAQREVSAIGGLPPVLRIGLSDGLVQPRLSDLFQHWQQLEPTVHLHITELPAYQQQDALQTEQIDIGLGFGASTAESLVAEPIWSDPMRVVVPHDHELAQVKSLTFDTIATYPLVLCHPRLKSGLREQIETMLQAAGFVPASVETADTLAGMIVRVGARHGLGFLDANHAQTLMRPDVVMVPLAEPQACLTVQAVTKRERQDVLVPLMRRFIDLARETGNAAQAVYL